MKLKVKIILLLCILPIIQLMMACAEKADMDESILSSSAESSKAERHALENRQSFNTFYKEFSNTVQQGDWASLARMAVFPFVLRAELDDEPKVDMNNKTFINLIPLLFNEEVYISINDELIATNYQEIILNRHTELTADKEEVQLFGLYFNRGQDGWKFTGITTHVHIVETYAEGM